MQNIFPTLLMILLLIYLLSPIQTAPVQMENNGDIFMRVDDMIILKPSSRAGLSSEDFRWPNGVIPYSFENGLPNDLREMIQNAMEYLEEHSCLEFKKRTEEKNYLFISHSNKGCYSFVGFMERGKQKLNLGKGCWKFATVLHELIHTIGFSHEHQRADRDNYVTIQCDNVKQDKKHNFMLDNEMGMNFNYFGLPYNYASIMHYGKVAFSANGKSTIIPKKVWKVEEETFYEDVDENGRPVIGQRKITWGDIEMINRMYNDDYCSEE